MDVPPMLFHVTHTHTEHTCPINDQGVMGETFGKVLSSLTESGVDVVGWWGDPPAHQMFFVLDADSVEAIYEGLHPIIDQGTACIKPVTDAAAKIQALMGDN